MIPSYMRCEASEPSEPHDTRCDTGNGDGPDTNRDVNVDFYRYKDTRLAVDKGKPYDSWCDQGNGDEAFSNRDVNVDFKRYTNAL